MVGFLEMSGVKAVLEWQVGEREGSVGRTFRPELLYYLLHLPRRLGLTPGTSHAGHLRH